MTVRELLEGLIGHAADGRRLDDVVHLRVGHEVRQVEASYSDGTFILIAGDPVR